MATAVKNSSSAKNESEIRKTSSGDMEEKLAQDAVKDCSLRTCAATLANTTKQRFLMSDWCRHLANWTKHMRRL